ncbi:DUF2922 domain-containing protein [Halalkalibacter akibai]|uniref:DUF2922 domain-containing protein n=1 Tax=Halalkalibacter akibai (strain ATCC 43226 / DSM 21942 / CIP 109018 / JCM 9157 / 1139) TaxID=1236973 RepID=W4QWJ5_HALA3|nr:DUF2922 domain-containing protein [Halalkalibacter akibai]GAE36451.1 hypothetical protein JCM9157_3637 [Halalkalibacter akibai JCM 9157]
MEPILTLELRFNNEQNRQVTIRIPNPKTNLTAQEVSAVMDVLLNTPALGGHAMLITSKIDARIVSRGVDVIM